MQSARRRLRFPAERASAQSPRAPRWPDLVIAAADLDAAGVAIRAGRAGRRALLTTRLPSRLNAALLILS